MPAKKQANVLASREYKVMLNPRKFSNRESSVARFGAILEDSIGSFQKRKASSKLFLLVEEHQIVFLDTEENSINANRLLLRERTILGAKEKIELTLKCRSPDYFIAVSSSIDPSEGLKAKSKFEEDIGSPFVSKFSRSTTVALKGPTPTNFDEAIEYFPALKEVAKASASCQLKAVNGLRMNESVYKGPQLTIHSKVANFALILWSRKANGKIAAAELSFRYALEEGQVDRLTALRFLELFESIQQLDWCSAISPTKTEYLYSGERL